MNRNLFLAILSMDTYNRGYGRGIKFSVGESSAPRNEAGAQIGSAAIIRQSNVLESELGVAAGFYAIAYDVSGVAGLSGTVIAYRGSDDIRKAAALATFLSGGIFGNPTGDDISNGYGVAFGVPDGPQATLAIEFYKAVAESTGATAYNEAEITTTGHSLGGGLAGLVAGLYNRAGFYLDPMNFGLALENAISIAGPDATVPDDALRELIYGSFGALAPWEYQSRTDQDGVFIPTHTNNQITASNRLDAARNTFGLNVGAPLSALDLPEDTPLTNSSRNQVGQRHANDLIVMRMFSDLHPAETSGWESSSRYWMPSLFDESVGDAAGAKSFDGTDGNDLSGTMRTAIAYSAIDEGERPFGDTGIWSMFNDAGDLGVALEIQETGVLDAITGLELR